MKFNYEIEVRDGKVFPKRSRPFGGKQAVDIRHAHAPTSS